MPRRREERGDGIGVIGGERILERGIKADRASIRSWRTGGGRSGLPGVDGRQGAASTNGYRCKREGKERRKEVPWTDAWVLLRAFLLQEPITGR